MTSEVDRHFEEEIGSVCEALRAVLVRLTGLLGDSVQAKLSVAPPVQGLGKAIPALHDRGMSADDLSVAPIAVGLREAAAWAWLADHQTRRLET